jgi:hypothetical protein
MSADTNALQRSVAEVTSMEGPEEKLVAEDSPISNCLPGPSFNRTMEATFLIPLTCCVT